MTPLIEIDMMEGVIYNGGVKMAVIEQELRDYLNGISVEELPQAIMSIFR